jgi:hypothetical protein
MTLRPLLAWVAAALAGSALGAGLTIALVLANGLSDWPFLGWVWLGLTGVGSVIAVTAGGATAMLALALGKRLSPPRPLADMAVGAATAFAILLGVRALVFSRMEEGWSWPEPGAILLVPMLAGAAAGWVYWSLAGRPA